MASSSPRPLSGSWFLLRKATSCMYVKENETRVQGAQLFDCEVFIRMFVACLFVSLSFSSSPSSSPRSHNKCVWCLVSACSLSSWYVLCNKQGIFKMEAGAFDEFQPTHEIVRRKCPIIFFRKFYCGSGNHLKICHVWTYTYEYVCVWTYSQIKKKTSGLT